MKNITLGVIASFLLVSPAFAVTISDYNEVMGQISEAADVAIVSPPSEPPPSNPEPTPRHVGSGIGHYVTPITGEMAKNPEQRKGAYEVPCPSIIREPGAKCVDFK